MSLHPFQERGRDHAVESLTSGVLKQLYAAPTGVGKSYVINAVREELAVRDFTNYVVAPTDEILNPFARKAGVVPNPRTGRISKARLEAHGYYTPVRLRNLLLRGDIPPPKGLIIDEAHHDEAETYRLIDVLMDSVPTVGYTATPFRGTPKSTQNFLSRWGDPVWLITLREAVESGYVSFPQCSIVPLMDDDQIEVVNGEFVVSQVQQSACSCIQRVVDLVRPYSGKRPTMISLPNVFAAEFYAEQLTSAGIPAKAVTGETPYSVREKVYAECLASKVVMTQVQVISEGVDLPIRVQIDLAPCMSPVLWQQRFGRTTRPVPEGEEPPVYICGNRNLARHAYLLDGLLPPIVYSQGETAFNGPSNRRNVRALGFESLGKFTTVDIPLYNGTSGSMVVVQKMEGNITLSYAALASPLHPDVLYACRENVRSNGVTSSYGRWKQIDSIPNLERGFASAYKGTLSEKQLDWWHRSARWYGLDPEAEVNSRSFNSLGVLKDTGFRFR